MFNAFVSIPLIHDY